MGLGNSGLGGGGGGGGGGSKRRVGTTTIGTESPGYTITVNDIALKKISLASGESISGIEAHLNDNGSNTMCAQVLVYSDNSGAPEVCLAANAVLHESTTGGIYFGGTAKWFTLPVEYLADSTQDVWIGVKQMADASPLIISYEATGGSDYTESTTAPIRDIVSATPQTYDFSLHAIVS